MKDRERDVVGNALDRMEGHARMVKLAIVGAVGVEAVLLIFALLKVDWSDPTHVLLFVFAVLGYTIVALGLAALGAHVSSVGARVVAAIDGRDPG